MNDAELVDLLLQSNDSVAEIARQLECEVAEVRRRVRQLGMDWVLDARRSVSRGHGALLKIMQDLLPGKKVVTEHPLGERLKLDVYCPVYKLAAEYHGRQHFEYIEHFHGDRSGYDDSVRRDIKKILLCELKGIALVTFTYKDWLSEDEVYSRMLAAIQNRPEPPVALEVKRQKYGEEQLQRQRDWRRNLYRQIKAERDT